MNTYEDDLSYFDRLDEKEEIHLRDNPFCLPPHSILLIDGSNLLYRSHFVHPYLTANDGTPTGGVYGFIQYLNSFVRELKPAYMIVAIDEVRECFRNDIYPAYKGTRSEREESIKIQFGLLKEYCEAANIQLLNEDCYEADDLLGSMAQITLKEGLHPYLVSGDRDLFQLVNEEIVMMYLSSKNKFDFHHLSLVEKKYDGFSGEQIIEIKALCGDQGDNVPGVRGIGEKTAIKLLKQFGSLDGIYENIHTLKGKQKEKLEQDKELAYLSKKLVTIKTDISLNFEQRNFDLSSDKVRVFLDKLNIK